MKKYLSLVLLLSVLLQWASAQLSKQQADTLLHKYIEQEIHDYYWLYDHKDTLSERLAITTWPDTFLVSDVYAYFIDEKPNANWNHPCRYVFIDKRNGTIETRHAQTPPFKRDWTLKTERIPSQPKAVFDITQTINRQSMLTKATTYRNDYAIIINGGRCLDENHERFWNNCSFMYKVLVGVYQYHPSHIYVIMSDGTNPNIDRTLNNGTQDSSPLDLDGNGTDDIQYSATINNIANVFDKVAQRITKEDNLFVYITDHGGKSTIPAGSYLDLWNFVTYYPYQLATELNKIQANTISIVMNQCNSGGFIPTLEGSNRVIMTACSADQVAYATDDFYYDEFSYYWISAMAGRFPNGTTVNADANNDGFVSMEEAFLFAKNRDKQNETPQYSSVNPNTGRKISLAGYICPVTDIVNETVTQNKSVSNCAVNIQNTVVKNGAKLTITAETETLINGPFEVEKGAELEIK